MKKILLLFFTGLLLAGCGSLKKVTYFNDIDGSEQFTLSKSYEITIQPSDFLSIVVNTESVTDAELALSFNGPMMDAGMRGNVSSGSYNSSFSYDRDRRGYLVDPNGDISFPLLGKIHVQDMTRDSLMSHIESRIREEGFIASPIVTASIVNLKVAVMGEVSRPGQFSITSDRITILEALSMAGDMTIYGNRRQVKVIREADGVRSIAVLNLNKKETFESPYFYLRQNDVVYVEPNKRKAEQGSVSPMWSLGVSTGSLLISLTTLIMTIIARSK